MILFKEKRMYIISAKYIFLCDEQFSILENKAFVFENEILELGELEELKKRYPGAKLIKTSPNCVILPAFINPHTHLEFSAKFDHFAFWRIFNLA